MLCFNYFDLSSELCVLNQMQKRRIFGFLSFYREVYI